MEMHGDTSEVYQMAAAYNKLTISGNDGYDNVATIMKAFIIGLKGLMKRMLWIADSCSIDKTRMAAFVLTAQNGIIKKSVEQRQAGNGHYHLMEAPLSRSIPPILRPFGKAGYSASAYCELRFTQR
jgi:hypothetical protein